MTQRILLAALLVFGLACGDSKNAVGVNNPPPSGPVTAGTFNARSVVVNGTTYKYQVFVPSSYSSQQSWPVILELHSSGEKGSDNQLQLTAGLGPVVAAQPAFPAIVVFPQMPAVEGGPPFTAVAIAELDQAEHELKIDTSREYITGFSLGAIRLYPIVSAYPTRFAAAVPISGTICIVCGSGTAAAQDSAYTATLTPMRNVPIWIFHGANDASVPVADDRLIVQILNGLHAPVKYTEYPNASHTIWDQVYASPDLYTWLFAQHR